MVAALRPIQFQATAAETIATRYRLFANHDERPGTRRRESPFFQALAGITGCGKTPILADAVSRICLNFTSPKPVVLWMSKARSVVQQTQLNFVEGGKYANLLGDFTIASMKELKTEHLEDGSRPLLITTTTGLFNNKNGSEGPLSIYKVMEDVFGEGRSMWDALKSREAGGVRRPLFVVYDEAHNLSEQQTNRLEELEPEAYLLASATLKLPPAFAQQVQEPVRNWASLHAVKVGAIAAADVPTRFLVTAIDPQAVVDAQLIKRAISFDGTTAPMEQCIDDLLLELRDLEIQAAAVGVRPKAIYVCNTNISDDGTRDDPDAAFSLRTAPPIRIWRFLVSRGVDPDSIAVYTSELKLQENFRPDNFHLFGKKEEDFERFQQGNFQHIIFNQSLQEGWDDPECYFGYIDKSIGSSVRVEQIIGRVLRQPGVQHYEAPDLNVARFFLRVDKEGVFREAIDEVAQRLQDEGANILVTQHFSQGGASTELVGPREEKLEAAVLGRVCIDAADAMPEIRERLADYTKLHGINEYTQGQAQKARAVVTVGKELDSDAEWVMADASTRSVRLRWLLSAKIRERAPRVASVLRLDAPAFDTLVQFGSMLERQITADINELARAYYEKSELSYVARDRFAFGPIRVTPASSIKPANSLYPRYSGLNPIEKECARALDRTEKLWHRNPSAMGGYGIPRLDDNGHDYFYPDFLVWLDDVLVAIDTKGPHLLTDALRGKMFEVKDGRTTKLVVRFIVKGKQSAPGDDKYPNDGYTVWKLKSGKEAPYHCTSMDEAVRLALKV